ncbi:Transcription initiation factor IIF subunit beta [Cyberlindnera fabianii]|uniref:Transcription initiation factor IIF subunit beta n=1 Tax=Cyberlindnera fabianii TaxID=36022 RepID=A0A1V2LD42_CYBFA|nr:Transcription initiation factor IIF subunit beta [Cyberlindnera fabianii]
MTSETTATAKVGDPPAAPDANKAQQVLAQQQENDNSDEEEFLSDTAEVIDANDATQYAESFNFDLTHQDEKVWLVRVPRFLAAIWKDKEAMQGQTLGKIRIKKNMEPPTMKLQLEDTPEVHELPHNYDLQLSRATVENQFVFAEKNYKRPKPGDPPQPVKSETSTATIPGIPKAVAAPIRHEPVEEEEPEEELTLEQKEFQRRLRFLERKKRRFNKYKNKDGTEKTIPFVKTIPKQTAMRGTIVHEATVTPSIKDPNYKNIIAQRSQYFRQEPRPSVTLLKEHSGVSLSNAGLTMKTDTSTFLKKEDPKKNRGENRSIRMPEKDLLDLLFKLFDQYDYWSLKGLKERTKQPEVYLKEVLDKIAVLIKKGPYLSKYALKKEYKELKDQERAKKVGELGGEDEEEEDEEEEEDVEMEDVV